jgi:putative transposase
VNGSIDLSVDDVSRHILLALSDNGPQMTSGSTREFLALCAIAAHFGRPGCPAAQAWIESLVGRVKAEWPQLENIRDLSLSAELERIREHYNDVRLHAGHVTPNDEHTARGEAIRQAPIDGLARARERRLPIIDDNESSTARRSPDDQDCFRRDLYR